MQPKNGLKPLEKASGFVKQHLASPNSFIHSFRNKTKPKISKTPHFPSLSNALPGNKARASLNASQTTAIYPNPEKQFWLKTSKLKNGKKSLKFFLLACTLIAIIIPLTVFGLGSSSWDTNSSSEFDLGTYFQTDFNASDTNGFVHLLDGNTQGDYNSPIFDSNYTAYWKTLSWE